MGQKIAMKSEETMTSCSVTNKSNIATKHENCNWKLESWNVTIPVQHDVPTYTWVFISV